MKKYFHISLVAIACSLLLVSCNKQNREYLLGEWELLSKPYEGNEYRWYFSESKVYVMATDANEGLLDGSLDTCAFGAYVLKNGVLTLALPEVTCAGSVYHGDWDIQGLTESYMTIRRETDNGTLWYEFAKVTGESQQEEGE